MHGSRQVASGSIFDVGQKSFHMKHLLPIFAGGLLVGGCRSVGPSHESPALRSEREYAEATEVRAQELYRTGQVSSIAEARTRAAGETNAQWAAAAKRTERKAKQDKFEKDLSKILGDGK